MHCTLTRMGSFIHKTRSLEHATLVDIVNKIVIGSFPRSLRAIHASWYFYHLACSLPPAHINSVFHNTSTQDMFRYGRLVVSLLILAPINSSTSKQDN